MGKLGAYSFDAPLGESPIGLAFAATHASAPREQGRFELVRIRATLAMQPEVEQALRDCARRVPVLDHDNLVRVFEVAEGDDPYVVSERRAGRTLDDVLTEAREQGRLISRPVALAIAREVLRGLAHLHRALGGPVVHGGVHPRMVVVDSQGAVRLGGLVAARVIAAAAGEEPELLRGSLGYVAPEIALGDAPDTRTDVFSAGVLCYQLVTGVLPPAGVLTPPELDDVVARALRTDPTTRYADAGLLLDALEGVLERAGASHVSATDIALFVGELFGQEALVGRSLAAPRMPLAAPSEGRRLPSDALDEETTHVSSETGQVPKNDALADETDDLLALLGTPGAHSHNARTGGETVPGGDPSTHVADSTTNVGFNEPGKTYLPPPAVEHTPDVLPQGKIRAPSNPDLAPLRAEDDPARDIVIASRQATRDEATIEQAHAFDQTPSSVAPVEPLVLQVFEDAAPESRARVDLGRPTPAPEPTGEQSISGIESGGARPQAPIAVAMAAARAAAASPPPRAPTLEDPLSGVDIGKRGGSHVFLYLTVVALLGALFAVLWFKTDLFHPERKKQREEARRAAADARRKDAEAKSKRFGTVTIRSMPPDSPVYMLLGRGPAEMAHLDGRATYTLVVDHEGYQRQTRVVTPAEFVALPARDGGAASDSHVARIMVTLTRVGARPAAGAADAGVAATGAAGGSVKQATLHVDTQPAGASVWLLVGIQNGATVPNLPIDTEYQFRVEADGYLPAYVVVKPDSWSGAGPFSFSSDVALEPVPAPMPSRHK